MFPPSESSTNTTVTASFKALTQTPKPSPDQFSPRRPPLDGLGECLLGKNRNPFRHRRLRWSRTDKYGNCGGCFLGTRIWPRRQGRRAWMRRRHASIGIRKGCHRRGSGGERGGRVRTRSRKCGRRSRRVWRRSRGCGHSRFLDGCRSAIPAVFSTRSGVRSSVGFVTGGASMARGGR